MPDKPLGPVQPIDRLAQDARVEWELPREGADGQAYTTQDNIRRWMKFTGVSLNHLARMAGLNPGTLSAVLNGSYKSDPSEFLRKAELAISEWYRCKSVPGGNFVTTRIAREIFGVIRATSRLRGIGVVTGPSGIGKTKALLAAVELDYPNAVILEINAGCASPLFFLRAILRFERTPLSARGKGVQPKPTSESVYSVSHAFNEVVDKLQFSGRIIIVDEADSLVNATFSLVRQLHDATKCPVLLCGRPPLQKRILRTVQDEAIGGSLVGRECVNHRIEPRAEQGSGGTWWFTTDEVVELLRAHKVKFTPDAARWLAALANVTAIDAGQECGGLRYAMAVLRLAMTMMQGGEGETLTAKLLKEVNRLLRGSEWSVSADHVANAMIPKYSATA